MISILIPTYNYDCVPLVEEMHRQATDMHIPFEIIVADDASSPDFQEKNTRILEIKNCRYIQLYNNIGPARIRNFLVSQAQFRHCLLMDADTYPANSNFLKAYWESKQDMSVICGGFIYTEASQQEMCPLRYKYGTKIEERPASARRKNPYSQFISMCFLADKKIFNEICFEESMHFGYEDCYFGVCLKRHSIPILHIENPVIHKTTDNAANYLEKIERSIRNLIPVKEQMRHYIRLLIWQEYIKRLHLSCATDILFRITKPLLRHNLTGNNPSLYLFAFYKLGYLCELLSEMNKRNRQEQMNKRS